MTVWSSKLTSSQDSPTTSPRRNPSVVQRIIAHSMLSAGSSLPISSWGHLSAPAGLRGPSRHDRPGREPEGPRDLAGRLAEAEQPQRLGPGLLGVAFWEVWHAHGFDEDDTVVERVCIGDPQIGNQQDIFGLLHEVTRLERFVDDLHVINHANDEPFLRSQPTVLVSFERGGFQLKPGFLEVGRRVAVIVELEVVILDGTAERALVLPDVGDFIRISLFPEHGAAKIDGVVVYRLPVRSVVWKPLILIGHRHHPHCCRRRHPQSAACRLHRRRRAAWSVRCRGGSRSRCSPRTGARRLSGRR